MADGIVPTELDWKIAKDGVMLQFSITDLAKNYSGTPEEAAEHFGLTKFIDNMISVCAYDSASLRLYTNAINKTLA